MERDVVDTLQNKEDLNFNSHAHVERDATLQLLKILFVISTHTLTWSVTKTTHTHHLKLKISTHTLTWSVTISFYFLFTYCVFQLTRSRGA